MENESDFTGSFFEIVEDELCIFGEVEALVEMASFGNFSAEKFVSRGIEPAVEGEKFENVGGFGFGRFARGARFEIDVVSRVLLKLCVMEAAEGKGSVVFFESGQKFSEEGGLHAVIAVDKTNKIASCKFKTAVAGGGLTSVFLVDDFDAAVFFGVGVADFARIVGGAIVD